MQVSQPSHLASQQLNQAMLGQKALTTQPPIQTAFHLGLLGVITSIVGATLFVLQRHLRRGSETVPLLALAPLTGVRVGGAQRPSMALRAEAPDTTPFPATGTEYDVVVIGSGPGGEAASVLAAQLGARVAVLEKKSIFGGPTGLTSKAVRHAVKAILSTAASLGGNRDAVLHRLWSDFPALLNAAQTAQAQESRTRLVSNKVQLVNVDDAKVQDNGTRVLIRRGKEESVLKTKYVIIATGSRPARPSNIPFTEDVIMDAAEFPQALGKRLPDTIGIIGGGVIGVEYALVLSSIGVKTTVFSPPNKVLTMLPEVLREDMVATLKANDIDIVGAKVDRVEPLGTKGAVHAGDKTYTFDMVLYSMGRDGNSDDLGLEDLGIKIGKYGRLDVDENFRTSVPNVFAIGDVTGSGLASLASKAGRGVAKFVFQGITEEEAPELFGERPEEMPLTLWTVPEMASVGESVESAQAKGLKLAAEGGQLVVGSVKYSDLVQGRLAGGVGFVQVVAQWVPEEQCHRILGMHILGQYANDLIQVAAMLIHGSSTLELVANTPWAAVTMSALLQHAADDALAKSPYTQTVIKARR